jgi:hypothetical protein
MIQYDFTDMLLKYASRRKRHFNSMILDGCEGTVLQRPVMNKLHWYKAKWLGKGCYIVLEHSEKREGRKDGIMYDCRGNTSHNDPLATDCTSHPKSCVCTVSRSKDATAHKALDEKHGLCS